MRLFFLLLFTCSLFTISCSLLYAQADIAVSQIERSEDLIGQNDALDRRIEEGEKTYIKKIIFEGAALLKKEQLERIVGDFSSRWLSKKDLQQLLDEVSQLYKNSGLEKRLGDVSCAIEEDTLIVEVSELTS